MTAFSSQSVSLSSEREQAGVFARAANLSKRSFDWTPFSTCYISREGYVAISPYDSEKVTQRQARKLCSRNQVSILNVIRMPIRGVCKYYLEGVGERNRLLFHF